MLATTPLHSFVYYVAMRKAVKETCKDIIQITFTCDDGAENILTRFGRLNRDNFNEIEENQACNVNKARNRVISGRKLMFQVSFTESQ